jgi:mannose-6-phosphate isomerase-like protein (cupin superfamily)
MMGQEWLEELDALQAAAAYHFLQMENEQVRVLETRIPAGHTVPVHTHRWPCVFYVLSWSDFVRRDAEGNVLLDTRGEAGLDQGTSIWSEPLGPHSVENVGNGEIRLLAVELKMGVAGTSEEGISRVWKQ